VRAGMKVDSKIEMDPGFRRNDDQGQCKRKCEVRSAKCEVRSAMHERRSRSANRKVRKTKVPSDPEDSPLFIRSQAHRRRE
jgi:hypothetical protein